MYKHVKVVCSPSPQADGWLELLTGEIDKQLERRSWSSYASAGSDAGSGAVEAEAVVCLLCDPGKPELYWKQLPCGEDVTAQTIRERNVEDETP